ncbi:MAG: UDP-3-O-[3-hydroxymyristoyl] N-acetylglucosamine deacetylase [Deltaproteobacteria bacterium RBG_19FT_COMBO_60_16]|nr:MAG: UDP-3-O-[3-hydroxymyristoyl] N-acetylglucosamine deacetylase [Deltaproteobacteria bacterium RBG_16_64_85]OGQ00734.1 MAG: UDP-3-O-[3-hydroxymyristoyl] N-acetylglucosamine deacetylase [Deltaproteobacteria bacterium RBG_19FT_COMBO_60_16]
MRIYQRTISTWVQFSGIGLHTGMPSFARILPAAPDTGIMFRRTDNGAEIQASVENVVETAYATVLASGGARISTVEHFLAALYGMEIDNAVVEVDGPELPILDGSARQVAEAIDFVGTVESPVRRRFLWVSTNEKLQRNGSMVALAPSENFEVLVTVDFPGTLIGKQWLKFTLTPENFLKEIAPARTFVLREQIDALWKAGLAKGGSLENAIVVEGDKVLNADGLRFQNEFARHKLLDFIGDLALVSRPVRGFFLAVRPGHTVNRCLTEHLSGLAAPRSREPAVIAEEPVAISITA